MIRKKRKKKKKKFVARRASNNYMSLARTGPTATNIRRASGPVLIVEAWTSNICLRALARSNQKYGQLDSFCSRVLLLVVVCGGLWWYAVVCLHLSAWFHCPANMLMLGQRWPNVCSYVGSTSHANIGSTLFCSLGLRWPYRWRQPFANLQPMLIQRWPNVIQYGITLGQRWSNVI